MNQVPYPAPNFSLPESGSGVHKSLNDFRSKWIVLYFYPKDETPDCTTEACEMRDARDALAALDAEVIGVSRDEPNLHEKFKTKYSLNFYLLTDTGSIVSKAYGAWKKKLFGGEETLRKTFLIDPEGSVRKVYSNVTPLGHGQEVIAELKNYSRLSFYFKPPDHRSR